MGYRVYGRGVVLIRHGSHVSLRPWPCVRSGVRLSSVPPGFVRSGRSLAVCDPESTRPVPLSEVGKTWSQGFE